MLLDDFYSLIHKIELEPHCFEALIKIEKKHAIFEGHFPNFPVTPGVGMIQILKNLVSSHLHEELFLQSASNVKFLSIVDPEKNSELVFNIQYQQENELIKVKNITSFKDGTPVLKCNVTFVKK